MAVQPEELNNSLHSTSSNNSQIFSEIKNFTITKDKNGSFGINIIGGADQPYIPGNNGIFICRIRRTDLNGIKEGDQILAVNGMELTGKTHSEVVKLLKEANNTCEFTIEINAERKIASNYDSLTENFERQHDGNSMNISTSTTLSSLPDSLHKSVNNKSASTAISNDDNDSIVTDQSFTNSDASFHTAENSPDEKAVFAQEMNEEMNDYNNNDTNNNSSLPIAIVQSKIKKDEQNVSPSSFLSVLNNPVHESSRTRESSTTSTITYSAIQNDSSHKITTEDHSRIEGSDIADENTSLAVSSEVSESGTLLQRSQTPLPECDVNYEIQESSNIIELLTFVGISVGIITLIAFAYIGCRRQAK